MTTIDPRIPAAIKAYEARPADGHRRHWMSIRSYVESWPEPWPQGVPYFFYWHTKDGTSYQLASTSSDHAQAHGLPQHTDVLMSGLPEGLRDQKVLDQHYVREAAILALVDAPSEDEALALVRQVFPDARPRFVHAGEMGLSDVCRGPIAHPSSALLKQSVIAPYRKEFPDYDDEIPHIPGMVDSSWHNDAAPCFANEIAGFRLWCDYKSPALSQEPINELRAGGRMKRFALAHIHDPFDVGKDESIIETDDFEEILDAYARAWFEKVVEEIGPSFQPDVSLENYLDEITPGTASQYEEMIAFVTRRIDDVYAYTADIVNNQGATAGPTP